MLSIITIIENTTNAIPLTYGTMMRSGGSSTRNSSSAVAMMGNSTENVLVGVVSRLAPNHAMPRTSAAMIFSECTISDCCTNVMLAVESCEMTTMAGAASPIMAMHSSGFQKVASSVPNGTVR